MTTPQPKYLSGRTVYFRPIDPRSDADNYYRWMNDREVTRWILRHLPIPFPAELKWTEDVGRERPTTDHAFALCLHDGDEHIGSVGIHRIDWIDRTGSTGLLIGAKEHWKHDLGFEAALVLLRYAFSVLNLRKVTSATIAPNIGSNRIHEKCGCREVGRHRLQFFRDGEYHDEILWELFSDEFAEVAKRHAEPLTAPR